MKLSELTPLQWIGIIILFNGTLIGGSNFLADLFMSAAIVKALIAIASLGNMFLGGLVTMFSSAGSMVKTVAAMPGVDSIAVNAMANKTLAQIATSGAPDAANVEATPAAKAAVAQTARASAIVLAILLGALFALPGDAHAQGVKVRFPTPLSQKASSSVDPIAKAMDDLSKVKQEVVDGVIADLDAADVDAATLTNPADPQSFRDPLSHLCYPAAKRFLQSLPVSTPATGKFVLVQLFQKKRDFVMQIQSGLPLYLKIGCSPLLGDEVAVFNKLLGLVGVQVGLNAIAPGSGVLSALSF